MAATTGAQRRRAEVIDLVSDDDVAGSPPVAYQDGFNAPTQEDSDAESATYHTPPPVGGATPHSDFMDDQLPGEYMDQIQPQGGSIINIDGEEIFIPDETDGIPAELVEQPPAADNSTAQDQEIAMSLNNAAFTVDDCLQRVLEIFPDISHEYVTDLYNGFDHESDYEVLPGHARLDNIMEQLVSATTSYPKQEKGKQALKRKRQDSLDESENKKWEQADRVAVPHHLKGPMQAMLKAEFPEIPVQFINDTLAAQKHLYQAYVTLAKAKDNADGSTRAYGRGRPSTKHLADAATIATNCGWPELTDELNAARRRVEIIRNERAAEDAKKMAEQENLQRAMEAGETAECSACFDELPMNRQIHCDGAVAHFTCFDCTLAYIKSEVGESRCRVLCTAGCGSGFAPQQLNRLSDKQLLEKLAQLQQEKDIRDAGLDDLEECPFCDYKAILPPVEEDFEFRCANSDCQKVSCRRCKCISHIPISCEQHAKDNKVNSRHKIEEAMTAAMIRSCNKCKKQFIKDYGCNKMSCPSCGNLQCYVCSTTIRDYNHFDQSVRPGGGGGASNSKLCPLYDNVEERHEREVKEAEAAARAQVVEENPDVSPDDLEIKLSDAVKKATTDRIKRGGGPGGIPGLDFIPPLHAAAYRAMVDGGADEDDDDPDEDADFAVGVGLAGARARMAVRRERAAQLAIRRADRVPHVRAYANPPAVQPAAAAPVFGQGFGAAGGMQGFIPVYGLNPPPPQVQQAEQNPYAQQPLGAFDQAYHRVFGDINRAAAPVPAPLNINHQPHVHPRAQQMPGAYPGTPQPQAAAFAARGANALMPGRPEQGQEYQQLEILRRRHDALMQQRAQLRLMQQQYAPEQLRGQQQQPPLNMYQNLAAQQHHVDVQQRMQQLQQQQALQSRNNRRNQ